MTNIFPTEQDAKDAIKILLKFIGEDPNRIGLQKTPDRVVKSYAELFAGYHADFNKIFDAKFHDVPEFQDIIMLRNISFNSICEHHMLPIKGHVDIGYVPYECIIGISKLARVVNAYARRLQVQERMTVQIAQTIQQHLSPLGVAVRISASHSCMTMRGVCNENSIMNTNHYTGIFAEDKKYQSKFIRNITAC